MAVTPVSLGRRAPASHRAGAAVSPRAMQFVTLHSVSRPGHSVFRSLAPKAVWPTGEELTRFSARTLSDRGIVKLRHFSFNGDPGMAFITRREAAALCRHFNLKTIEELSRAEIIGRRDISTEWTLKGRIAAPAVRKSLVDRRKQWLTQVKRFWNGQGEAPPAMIARIDQNGDLSLFSLKIPLHTFKGSRVKIEAARKGKWGVLYVARPSGRPLINAGGKALEKIVMAENGLLLEPQVVWST